MPIARISAPNTAIAWPGISPKLASIRAPVSIMRDSAARAGNWGNERIRDKLIDMATTTSPANAAEAPTSATKKFAQSASGAFIPTSCEIRPTSAVGLEEPPGALEITQGAYGGRGDDRLSSQSGSSG